MGLERRWIQGTEDGEITQRLNTDNRKTWKRRMRRNVALNEQRSMVRHEELYGRKSYGKETWRVSKICQETVMITK